MEHAHGGSTLNEIRTWLRGTIRSGAVCPACEQVAKIYKRSLNSNMSRILIRSCRAYGQEWFHAPTMSAGHDGTGDLAKLRYWNLVEEEVSRRADGGRAGWWRVTELGADFVAQRIQVPKYARIYNGRLLGLETPSISITAALGKKFNYSELMSA